jgi:putative Holliday junction resolvase
MARILGVDLGDKRIGIAASDESATIAFPREVLSTDGRIPDAVKRVARYARKEQVAAIVVGLPLNMDGSAGRQAERTRSFAGLLRKELPGVEVVEWDERLSTVQASRAMYEAGVDARGQRGALDKVAAALLLQAYLDFRRDPR